MREIGFVKSFVSKNNYGLIITENGKEIFVHINDILSNPTKLKKGKIVTYAVALNARKNLEKAIEVKVIDDESDDLIKSLSEKPESKYWIQALSIHLEKLPFSDALSILKEKLVTIQDHIQKQNFIKNLNPKFFKNNIDIRTILDNDSRAEVCLTLLNLNETSEEEALGLMEEVLESIRGTTTFSQYYFQLSQHYFQRIPQKYLTRYKHYRIKLDNDNYIIIIKKMLEEYLRESKNIDALIDEFESFTNTNFFVASDAWNRLPEKVYEKRPDLIKKLSLDRQFELIKKNILMETENMQHDKLLECMRLIPSLKNDTLYDQLPQKYYEIYKDIRNELPLSKHFAILNKIYLLADNGDKADQRREFIDQITKEFKENNFNLEDEEWFNLVPKDILFDTLIWPLLQQKTKLLLLLETKVYNQNNVEEIEDLVITANTDEQQEMLSLLSDDIFALSKKTLPLLDPLRHAKIIWDGKTQINQIWQDLNSKTKMYLIYRSIKEGKSIEFLWNNSEETDIKVKVTTLLLQAKNNQIEGTVAFEKVHNLLQEFVVEKAWDSDENLDFYTLLPNCISHLVDYCETKPWPTEEDRVAGRIRTSRFFCPRGKGKCNPLSEISTANSGYWNLFGARLYPDMNLSWENWSLIELLEYSGIVPSLHDLTNSFEYVPKFSGWINRLNEIRSRLKCSYCNVTMIPNRKYSKHLAAYNQTIVSCSNRSHNHDSNIYLSHCWACREIIDSRESIIRVENYYLCIHCASGPKKSTNYTQGSICPKCGSRKISSIDQRSRKCNEINCLHNFTIPSSKYLTGF